MPRTWILAIFLVTGSLCAQSLPPFYDQLAPVRQGQQLLARGSQGIRVQALQWALTYSGYATMADGSFGPATEAQVKAFQSDQGLKADGIVGPKTMLAFDQWLGYNLGTPAPTPQPQPNPTPNPSPSLPPVSGHNVASIPTRSSTARTGSEFLAATQGLSRSQREAQILLELSNGNLPSFLRQFQEVTFNRTVQGQSYTVTVYVCPDYLAIGSDNDFLRIPMGSPTAQELADAFDCVLPTRFLVDRIWEAAPVRLAPSTMTPGPMMMSNGYYSTHQNKVETQLAAVSHYARGILTAGHKKDVVNSLRLVNKPLKVAIYGWHQLNGAAIQPLSTVHEATYADYSHGCRLIGETVLVDGLSYSVDSLLRDPIFYKLLSDEGAPFHHGARLP